jgi:hypothetical protein
MTPPLDVTLKGGLRGAQPPYWMKKYAENKEKIPASKQQNFEGFQSKFESEDKDLMKQIKTEVDMMVLNGGG